MTGQAIEGKILKVEMGRSEILIVLKLDNGKETIMHMSEKNFPFQLKDLEGKHLTMALTDK